MNESSRVMSMAWNMGRVQAAQGMGCPLHGNAFVGDVHSARRFRTAAQYVFPACHPEENEIAPPSSTRTVGFRKADHAYFIQSNA